MKLEHNTILITGGSSGLGLELARILVSRSNTVLICGRSKEKLEKAKEELKQVQIFPCDLSKPSALLKLHQWVTENYPQCNLLINNAAIVHRTDFYQDEEMIEKAGLEVQTNFMAPVTLCKLFLPLLNKNNNPSIINITTGLIYAPKAAYPIYNATKAALHSFTQVLRYQLKETPFNIIEVMMPAVDTPWHNGNPPKIAISPQKAIEEMVRKLEKGDTEIKVGGVSILYVLSRIVPAFALKKINEV